MADVYPTIYKNAKLWDKLDRKFAGSKSPQAGYSIPRAIDQHQFGSAMVVHRKWAVGRTQIAGGISGGFPEMQKN